MTIEGLPYYWPFGSEAAFLYWKSFVERHAIATRDCQQKGHGYGPACSRCFDMRAELARHDAEVHDLAAGEAPGGDLAREPVVGEQQR